MAALTSKLQLRKPDGTDLVNVLSDLDNNYDILDANPGTLIGLAAARVALAGATQLWAGRHAIDSDTGIEYVYDGANWVEFNRWSQWTQYVPVWSSTGAAPAIGNGSIVGRYRVMGKLLFLRIIITMGTTTTYGGIAWTISLPAGMTTHGTGNQLLPAIYEKTGGSIYMGLASIAQASTVMIPVVQAAAGAVSFPVAATPFAWANTDALRIEGILELV